MHFLWEGPGAAQATKTSIVIHFNCSQVGSRQLFKMKSTRESSVGERKWPRWEQWNPNKGDHTYVGEGEPPVPWPGMVHGDGGTGSEVAPLVLPPGALGPEQQQEGQGLGASQGQDANTLHMMDLHEGQIKHMEDGTSDSSKGDSDSTLPLPGAASSSSTQVAAASSPRAPTSANVQSTDRYWDANGSWSYWGGDWWQQQPGSTYWHKWKP